MFFARGDVGKAAGKIRLGFAVRSLTRPELGAGSGAAGGGPAHLSVALAGLGDMLGQLSRIDVRYYRAALALPAEGGFAEVGECAAQLASLAARLRASEVRVTVHLDHGLALGGADDSRAAAALAQIEATAALLEALDGRREPLEAVMVAHVGGPAGDPETPRRFLARYAALSPRARARLALEHDGAGLSLGQLLAMHERCGVPVVFDAHHWAINNPEGLPLDLALGLALATWPRGARPEVHLSSARGEAHLLPARGGRPARVLPPRPGQHADFINPGDLVRLLEAARGLAPFDLMLEAKAGDLALLRLRAELARVAPAVAATLG